MHSNGLILYILESYLNANESNDLFEARCFENYEE